MNFTKAQQQSEITATSHDKSHPPLQSCSHVDHNIHGARHEPQSSIAHSVALVQLVECELGSVSIDRRISSIISSRRIASVEIDGFGGRTKYQNLDAYPCSSLNIAQTQLKSINPHHRGLWLQLMVSDVLREYPLMARPASMC